MTNVLSGVLFLDIVRYSRMTEEKQAQALRRLDRVIASAEAVSAALAQGRVRIHPRGDGKLLIFSEGALPALHAAAQISDALRRDQPFDLRMGIHYGSVRLLDPDLPDSEVVGEGVDTARRVMDAGDERHILLSASAAAVAHGCAEWRYLVHSRGSCRVKHGVVMQIFSLHGLYGNRRLIGNEVTPRQVFWFRQDEKMAAGVSPLPHRYVWIAFAVLGVTALLAGFGAFSQGASTFASVSSSFAVKKAGRLEQRKTAKPAAAAARNKGARQGRRIGRVAATQYVMAPDFVQQDIAAVRQAAQLKGLRLEVKQVPNALYAKGIVCGQRPREGKWPLNKPITVYISNGDEAPEAPVVLAEDQADLEEPLAPENDGAESAPRQKENGDTAPPAESDPARDESTVNTGGTG